MESPTNVTDPHAKQPLRHGRLALAALVGFSLVTCLVGLNRGPPLGDHESINALAARNAIQDHQWLVPVLDDAPRIRKTPLGIWLIAAASVLTGHPTDAAPVTTFSARLPSAIAGVLLTLVVCWLGSMLFGRRTGLVAGFICAGCAATVFYARNAQVDLILTLFTALAFACFWRGALHTSPSRRFMALFYVAFALAMLAKAPLPLATVGLPLAVFWFVTMPLLEATQHGERRAGALARRLRYAVRGQVAKLRRLWLAPGLVVFVILVGAWPAYVFFHVDNVVELWNREYVARFTGDLSDRVRPFWYYLPIIFGLMIPFAGSVPEAFAAPFATTYRKHRRELAFAFTWAVVITVFVSAAAFKRVHYLLSAVPAFCLLLAPVIDRLFFGAVDVRARLVRLTCWMAPVLLAAAAIVGGFAMQRAYPALVAPYTVAVSAAVVVWAGTSWAFAGDRRRLAFGLFNLGVPILVVVMWPAIGRALEFDVEGAALTTKLRAHGVGAGDEIFWADRRPNYSIEFYTGFTMKRLIDPTEMAAIREEQTPLSVALSREIVRRIQKRFQEDRPVYMIMEEGHYQRLRRADAVPTRLVFRLDGFHEDPKDDLVVFTRIGVQQGAETEGPVTEDWDQTASGS